MLRLGIDVGSTTAKVVVLDQDGSLLWSDYRRHGARIEDVLVGMLSDAAGALPGAGEPMAVGVTGSIGLGVTQRTGLRFVQEVVAASRAARHLSDIHLGSMIDIGGEDAKVVFFDDAGEPRDLRMNGNCAAGTGSFIDQMSIILGESIESLSELASRSTQLYPIASRCGVFCKTDIQNLVARNVRKEDIAASIFHAVAVQTVVTLAHGYDIAPPVLLCGGPLTFIPSLREAFMSYLKLGPADVLVPAEGKLLPAIGAALGADETGLHTLSDLSSLLEGSKGAGLSGKNTLPPIFEDEARYAEWRKALGGDAIQQGQLVKGPMEVYLGIDSGSTTTKVVFTDSDGAMLFHYYAPNAGDPVGTASKGLEAFQDLCSRTGTEPRISGSCSTGYGEDLLQAAFRLDHGIIETIAHYLAASRLDPEVTFILDIGGQDMKAIYVDNGVINRIEINEACSSGCGSFIETFARSLGFGVDEFAHQACTAAHPCDLGTRCTVFMNSKVKQVLREGYGSGDIAAGLAYSVARNCLYKVLKLKDTSSLGGHIVVQGGTMRNDAVVRAVEILTGAKLSRSDHPEMMGAWGCALYAIREDKKNKEAARQAE